MGDSKPYKKDLPYESRQQLFSHVGIEESHLPKPDPVLPLTKIIFATNLIRGGNTLVAARSHQGPPPGEDPGFRLVLRNV